MGRPLMTPTNDSNPWWSVFKQAITAVGEKLAKPEILASTTDARYIRQLGIPVLGFSPMKNTPILLHDHNEVWHVCNLSSSLLLFHIHLLLLLFLHLTLSRTNYRYTHSFQISNVFHLHLMLAVIFLTWFNSVLQFLKDTVYLKGIEVYESLISSLSSFEEASH